MFSSIYKKIIKISDKTSKFVRENLAQLAIIGGTFVFLEVIAAFPYINIIPNYQFLVIGLTLFLTVILLRVPISNRKLILFVLILFLVAPIMAIFDLKKFSDLIGFSIFILLIIVVLRQVITERESFKNIDLEV